MNGLSYAAQAQNIFIAVKPGGMFPSLNFTTGCAKGGCTDTASFLFAQVAHFTVQLLNACSCVFAASLAVGLIVSARTRRPQIVWEGKRGRRVWWKCEREGGVPRAPREIHSAAAMHYEMAPK